jgi:hypothetical protein
MKPLALVGMAVLLAAVAGCVSMAPAPPKTYAYALDVRNRSEHVVTLVLVRAHGPGPDTMRTDIGAGGVYHHEFATVDRTLYVQARFTLDGRVENEPARIVDLAPGVWRYDVEVGDGRVVLTRRAAREDEE